MRGREGMASHVRERAGRKAGERAKGESRTCRASEKYPDDPEQELEQENRGYEGGEPGARKGIFKRQRRTTGANEQTGRAAGVERHPGIGRYVWQVQGGRQRHQQDAPSPHENEDILRHRVDTYIPATRSFTRTFLRNKI